MVAFVRKQAVLGDADNLTLGNTKAVSAATRATMQIAEGVEIKGKAPREVGLALCQALHMYLRMRHLFVQACMHNMYDGAPRHVWQGQSPMHLCRCTQSMDAPGSAWATSCRVNMITMTALWPSGSLPAHIVPDADDGASSPLWQGKARC
jgi:hypothetical protein